MRTDWVYSLFRLALIFCSGWRKPLNKGLRLVALKSEENWPNLSLSNFENERDVFYVKHDWNVHAGSVKYAQKYKRHGWNAGMHCRDDYRIHYQSGMQFIFHIGTYLHLVRQLKVFIKALGRDNRCASFNGTSLSLHFPFFVFSTTIAI